MVVDQFLSKELNIKFEFKDKIMGHGDLRNDGGKEEEKRIDEERCAMSGV